MTHAIEPTESFVLANGLRHHVIEWAPPKTVQAHGTFILCHGFLDLGFSYQPVAEQLVSAGYRAVAFDWRGHGQSEWVGPGGYYHFPDYLRDLDVLLPQLAQEDSPVHLVGHSMGGTAASLYAGVRSDRLTTLTLVEGLGPPESGETPVERVKSWFDTMDRYGERFRKPMPDIPHALRRMRIQNPDLEEDFGLFLAEKGTEQVEGGRVFRFDPIHRTHSPIPFRIDAYRQFLSGITVPTLYVAGDRGFRLEDEAERLSLIGNARSVEIADCGHMVHWFHPKTLAEHLIEFVE